MNFLKKVKDQAGFPSMSGSSSSVTQKVNMVVQELASQGAVIIAFNLILNPPKATRKNLLVLPAQ